MDDTPVRGEGSNRLERIASAQQSQAGYDPRYSVFIRRMRLILPLVALSLIAVVFTWTNMTDETYIPAAQEAGILNTVGKNELLNPRFESRDEKQQPYTITAKRAIQGETNEDLVILEKPIADMLLNSGNWIAIEAEQGAFRQDNQRLLLRGSVKLYHDLGYQLQMPQLYVDMDENTAWSEQEVSGQGPAGTINAMGLRANAENGHLLFSGPAKLVLNQSVTEGSLGGVAP